MRLRLLAAALAALAPLFPAHAQGTTGFFLSGRLLGAGLTVEDSDEADGGAGLGLRLGYGFTPLFTAFVGADGLALQPEDGEEFLENEVYGLGLAEVGLRLNFSAGRAVAPYAEVALTGIGAEFDFENTSEDVTLSGGGLTVGGGAQFFVSRTLAIDLGLDVTLGEFTEAEVDGDDIDFGLEDAEIVVGRVGVGLSFYPARDVYDDRPRRRHRRY